MINFNNNNLGRSWTNFTPNWSFSVKAIHKNVCQSKSIVLKVIFKETQFEAPTGVLVGCSTIVSLTIQKERKVS